MKLSIKNVAFIAVITFLACTLVASHGIHRYQLRASHQSIEDCAISRVRRRCHAIASSTDSSKQKPFCTNTPPLKVTPTIAPPLTPNLSLPEKDRFLALVTYKLPALPIPNTYEYTLLRAYGAAFINQEAGIKLPQKVVFTSEQETKQFQSSLNMSQVNNTNDCYLQKLAADALNRAKAEVNIPLKSGYGASDCTRSFATNLRFWNKYATATTLQRVRQGEETNILGIVAPPGSSQHLWGLAIDLSVSNAMQEYTLNQNGWFRTVERDSPHWTYLGLPPERLAEFGFMNKVVGGVAYWLTPL